MVTSTMVHEATFVIGNGNDISATKISKRKLFSEGKIVFSKIRFTQNTIIISCSANSKRILPEKNFDSKYSYQDV